MEKQPISHEKLNEYLEGMYRLTTVGPLVEGPHTNEYLLTQEELEAWLEGYGEFAELVVGVQFLGNNEGEN